MIWAQWLFVYCFLVVGVIANTESYLLSIPYHYEIPPGPKEILLSTSITKLNDSTTVIDNYPIIDKYSYLNSYNEQNVVKLSYNTRTKPKQRVVVKLNNYKDSQFQSNDLIYVKLCWPAILPYDFRILHQFLKRSSLFPGTIGDSLDIYVIIDYQANFVTYDIEKFTDDNDEVYFNLFVTKLPISWLPIPLELCDYIVYLVDLLLVTVPLVPTVLRIFDLS